MLSKLFMLGIKEQILLCIFSHNKSLKNDPIVILYIHIHEKAEIYHFSEFAMPFHMLYDRNKDFVPDKHWIEQLLYFRYSFL